MPVGDTRHRVELAEVRPRTAAADEIRHFDQLSHGEQRAFLRLYRGEDPRGVPLTVGEVVVFTGYYRLERT